MANSAVVGLLRVLLQAETAEFNSAMKSSANVAREWQRDLRSIGSQATTIGANLTRGLTLPILGVGVAASKLAIDFESSFAGVRKTVKGTEAELAGMAQGFRNLSKTIPINVNELNRLGEAAGALGIPKAQVVDFARVMALLGVTTNLTADQAAESIAKIQNIFGAAGKDTERFASTLVSLGKDGASTESQILEMATRIAGAGNALNMTQGQVLAFASALSSVGIEAEMGGSAISRVFIDIAAAVNEGGSEVEGFARVAGMSVAQFSKLFKDDAAAAVNAFVSGLGRIKQSGGDLIGTLGELGFSEIRVRDTLLRTAGAGDLLTNALKLQSSAWSQNTELTKTAAERFNTTQAQLTTLWNRLKDVGITLGNALLPSIRLVNQVLLFGLPILESIVKGFTMLPAPLQLITFGLVGLAAAAGPALYIFGQLALSAASLAGAFTAKGIATRALTANLGALRAAYALLVTPITATGVATGATTVAKGAANVATRTLTGSLALLRGALIALPFAAVTAAAGIFALAIVNLRERSAALAAQAAADARKLEAQGASGRAQVTARLAQMERELADAVRDGNKALANRLTADIEAIKNDQARLAMQDSITLAIKRGADANISYGDAVKYNAEWVAKQRGEQQAASRETEGAVGATNRLKAAQDEVTAANQKYAKELTGIRDALTHQIRNMEVTGKSVSDLATQYHISEQTVARLKSELEAKEKTDRKVAQAEDQATKAAERRRAELEKQEAAYARLGLVTERYITNELADLLEMENAARQNGADMNMVLRAMLPTLTELRSKAAQSGVEVTALAEAFDRASRAQAAFDKSLAAVPWAKLLGDMRAAAGIKRQELIPLTETEAQKTENLADAYRTLGLTSRKELRDQATAAIFAYNQIRNSGTATAAEIEAAYRAMVAAVNAANGQIPSFWQTVVVPGIQQGLNTLVSGFSDAFTRLLTGAGGFWDSFKQSALNAFAQILDSFINGLIKQMIAALAGSGLGGGGFSWGGLLRGALGGGGGVPGLGGMIPGMGGAAGLPGATGVLPSVGGGGAGAGAGGFLSSGLGTALGGIGVGAAGFGLGFLLSEKFGKTTGTIAGGLGGAATGALIGTAVFPGIGTGLGALIGGLSGVVGGLFGGGDDGDKARDKFIAQFGGRGTGEGSGFGTLQGKLGLLGDRGVALFEALIAADKEKKAVTAINEIVAAFNTLEFKQAEVNEAASTLRTQWELLAQRGLDERSILILQADGYSQLLAQIQKTGTEAPEWLKPIAEKLIEMGLLVDANGQKVTDLAQVFPPLAAVATDAIAILEKQLAAAEQSLVDLEAQTDPTAEGFADLRGELQRHIEAIRQELARARGEVVTLGDALDDVPTDINVDVNVHERVHRAPNADDSSFVEDWRPDGGTPGERERPEHMSRGGIVPQYAALGRRISSMVNWRPIGTDTVPAMLTPGELVLTEAQQRNLGATMMTSVRALELATSGGQARGDLNITLDMRGASVGSLEQAREIGVAAAERLAQLPAFQRALGREMRINTHGLGSDVRQAVKRI